MIILDMQLHDIYADKEEAVKKGDIYEAVVTNYDFPNKGSLILEDRKVTIKGALAGQKVRFMITRRKSGMAEGRLLEVLERSSMEDCEPSCQFFGSCGGCAYQNMSYENQLKLKEAMVKKLLDRALVKNGSVTSGGAANAAEEAEQGLSVEKHAGEEGAGLRLIVEENAGEVVELVAKECTEEEGPELYAEENAAGEENELSINFEWEGILPSPVQKAYRNKMEFTFGDEYKDGPLALGLHKKGSFHDILNVSGCEIIGEDWSRILDFTLSFFSDRNVPFYHRMRHTGILRNLVIRQSCATGEFLINLVAADRWDEWKCEMDVGGAGEYCMRECAANEGVCGDLLYKEELREGYCDDLSRDAGVRGRRGLLREEIWGEIGDECKALLSDYVYGLLGLEHEDVFSGKIAGILYTVNNSLGDVVQSDKTVCLYGRDFITEEVMGLKFKISPFSFFQTNTRGCEVLYEKAREYIMSGDVMKEPDKVVFDLYSGTGTIAQMMSAAAKKVIGIEIVEEAVEAARENAKLNGLTNCEFIAGDVLKAIDLVEDKPDVIVLDPPRDGINPKALEKILDYGVDEMVYISCKPTSLARDLEAIVKRGYRVVKACAVDQFPGTGHVETVVILSQRKADEYIEVNLELSELDVTSAETKATYKEIHDYVLEKYGLKVSNLYISQVKQKCGLEVGENYNLRKATRRMDCLQADSTTAANLENDNSQGMPKSEDLRQPKCPEEKEKAIKDALEHFGMV